MKTNLPRRKFLKTIGGAALSGAVSPALRISAQETKESSRPKAIVLFEPAFPSIDGCGASREILQKALEGFELAFLATAELIARLNNEAVDLLITPYGSAFPRQAWGALLQYLQAGGNWMNLGGTPLAVPVARDGDRWRAEVRQTTYHKRLGITQSFPVKADAIASYRVAASCGPECRLQDQFQASEIYELYVRLTSKTEILDESGSDGPREAMLHPLVFGLNRQGRPVAAPVIQIDRLQGDFAGGRWVLANFNGTLSAAGLRALAVWAGQSAFEFVVRSDFACYREGETPSFSVQASRPKGQLEKVVRSDCRIEVRNSRNEMVGRLRAPLAGNGALMTGSAKLDTRLAPGFYQVESLLTLNSASIGGPHELKYTSGFWVYDREMISRGRALTTDRHFFYRDGEVYPLVGTTYMASDVHRRFLFEPNPFVWDQDFREMKAAGVNLVRTGIWTGWKKFMPAINQMNEATLRAFDAFLLTAHKYDIPVIFTFFAFLPETWGGENPYLDPKAIQAQRQFVSAFAGRYGHVDDVMWDLINEPSFSSAKHLWNCRPNYDAYEQAAWRDWLKERYPFPTDEARAAALKAEWRTSDDPLELPKLQDFDNVNIFATRLPLKTLDYRLFAQDMFARWVKAMTEAIRSNGNKKQLITVGQDEGGTVDRPSPQFFAEAVDFTCLHNWWNNDELLWDSVVTKAPTKPSLIEETGVMFYERMDGLAWRTEEDARNLLERKLAVSLGADGAGVVEWVWNTNSYMDSENEVAIGFYRADGTAKPELEPFLGISKFMTGNRKLLKGRRNEEVLMVIPHSQLFSPRNFATEATRKCVRAMHYHCRTTMRAVSEYRLNESAGTAKMIVVPSPRVLSQECWEALIARAKEGATVVITGVLDDDDHWMPVERTKSFGWIAETRSVSESEVVVIGAREYLVRYEGDKLQRIEKAVVGANSRVSTVTGRAGAGGQVRRTPASERFRRGVAQVLIQPVGAGSFIWCPLPLELGETAEPLVAFYRLALAQARVSALFSVYPQTPSILIRPTLFATAALYTVVSETNRDTQLRLHHLEAPTSITLTVPAQRALMLFIDRKTGRMIGSTG